MADKTILSVDLYDNVLTEKQGDYSGKVAITGSCHNIDIAKLIVKERTEYRLETIVNILDLADQKKVELISQGKSLADGVGQYLLNIIGSFDGEAPTFDPEKNKFGVTFTPGKSLLNALKNLIPHFRIAKTGPVINSITDSTSQSVSQQITPNAPAIIAGAGLLLKGSDPSVGVYFTPDGEGKTPVRVNLIVSNTTSQIIIQVPQLADGQYWLSVTTQAGAGYTLVKEPRTYKFPILLTVDSQSDDDDRPVIE